MLRGVVLHRNKDNNLLFHFILQGDLILTIGLHFKLTEKLIDEKRKTDENKKLCNFAKIAQIINFYKIIYVILCHCTTYTHTFFKRKIVNCSN